MELSPIPSSQVPSGIMNTLSRPTTPGTHTPGASTLGVNSLSSQRPTPVGSPRPANTLTLNDNDIQQFGRFAREFVVMSLVPWMEKCVIEWNESVRNTSLSPGFRAKAYTVLILETTSLPALFFYPPSIWDGLFCLSSCNTLFRPWEQSIRLLGHISLYRSRPK